MRTGYPAPWTLGDQLESGWFGPEGDPYFFHWSRILAAHVDGVRLYDTHPIRRTPSVHEIRYSQKFSEVMLAVQALVRLDVREIAIDTGGATPHERPDLRAMLDGKTVAIEVGEVHPHAAVTNAAIELNIALNELADSDPDLRPVNTYLHICRSPGRNGSIAVLPKTRTRLLQIMTDILRNRAYREWVNETTHCVHAWPGAELGYTLYVARSLTPRGYIQFDDSACSFDPEGLTAPALRMLERKRVLAITYDHSLPLWLILGMTEQQGIYGKSLEALAHRAAEISPFERVIAHDGAVFATYVGESHAA